MFWQFSEHVLRVVGLRDSRHLLVDSFTGPAPRWPSHSADAPTRVHSSGAEVSPSNIKLIVSGVVPGRIKGTLRGLGGEDENSIEVNPEFSTNVFDTLDRAVTWVRLARDPARTVRDRQNKTDVEPLPLKLGSPVGLPPDHAEKGHHVYADRFDIAHR